MIKKICKKIYDFFYYKIEDIRKKKIIYQFDKQYLNSNKKKLINKDYVKLESDGILYFENFIKESDIKRFSKKLNYKYNNRNYSISNQIIKKNSLIDKILKNKKIQNILKLYIGNNVKLDFIEVGRIKLNQKKKSISEKWHYDTVGRRIKIFIYLNSNKNISTDYVLSSNQIIKKDFTTKGSRYENSSILNNYNKIFRAYPKIGSIIIFDTNGIHRGNYRNNKKNKSNEYRDTLQLEFSDKNKSNKLQSIGVNSIGVRNIFFSNDLETKNYLLDKNCIVKFENSDLIFYDRNFSNYNV